MATWFSSALGSQAQLKLSLCLLKWSPVISVCINTVRFPSHSYATAQDEAVFKVWLRY